MEWRVTVRAAGGRARRSVLAFVALLPIAGCPETHDDPDCGFDDLEIGGHLSMGYEGPACDPCSASDELFVVADVRSTCGLVEWETSSTCLVRDVVATPDGGGEPTQLLVTICPDGFGSWSVSPDEPLVVSGPALDAVFEGAVPPETFTFEIGIDDGIGLIYGSFTTAISEP